MIRQRCYNAPGSDLVPTGERTILIAYLSPPCKSKQGACQGCSLV